MVIINIPRTTEAGRIRYSCLVNKKNFWRGQPSNGTFLMRRKVLDFGWFQQIVLCFGGEFHHIFQNAQFMCPA